MMAAATPPADRPSDAESSTLSSKRAVHFASKTTEIKPFERLARSRTQSDEANPPKKPDPSRDRSKSNP